MKALKILEDFPSKMYKISTIYKEKKFSDLHRRQRWAFESTELSLEKIRETLSEKLQKTLEAKVRAQSFEMVSKQLQAVQKGLGEMQTPRKRSGDLKRGAYQMLKKQRKSWVKYQLQAILENLLKSWSVMCWMYW